jgi:hypothetical protein
MNLFEVKDWELTIKEEVYGLSPFRKLIDRDKTKDKQLALKELLFIYFFSDIKSDYNYIMSEDHKVEEIKKDINLPSKWKIDKDIEKAIELYKERSQTVIQKLYTQSLKSVSEIGNYLENTKELLEERDERGKPVFDISKITIAVQKVPKLMSDLKDAYKEVVKEIEDTENKKKGSQSYNIFEDGL